MKIYEMTFVSKDWKAQSGKAWDTKETITIAARNPRHALTLCGAGETIKHFTRVTSQSYYSVSCFNRNETNVAYKDVTAEYTAAVIASNSLTEAEALTAARMGLTGVESVTVDTSRANLYAAKLEGISEKAYIWLPETGANIFVAFSSATLNFRRTDVQEKMERDAIKAANPDGLTARLDEGRCIVCGKGAAAEGRHNCAECQTKEDALTESVRDSFAAQYELGVKDGSIVEPTDRLGAFVSFASAIQDPSDLPARSIPTCTVCLADTHTRALCPFE